MLSRRGIPQIALVALAPLLLAQPLAAQTAAIRATASKMVAAYRAYNPPEPFEALATTISAEQEAKIDSVVAAAKEVSGQSPERQELFNFVVATRAWFVQHGMTTGTSTIDYAARLRALDASTLNDWISAAVPLDVGPKDRILLVLAIAFNDPLWSGSAWAPGNPSAVIARLRSLPADAVTAWVTATGAGEVRFMAGYSLLTVDALFDSTGFRAADFQAALPIAKDLLATSR